MEHLSLFCPDRVRHDPHLAATGLATSVRMPMTIPNARVITELQSKDKKEIRTIEPQFSILT